MSELTSMAVYELAVQLMYRHPGMMHFCGYCQEKAVLGAEQTLNLRFPETYRRFLKEFGAGNFGGVEIYGIICNGEEQSSVPNTVWLTAKLRHEAELPIEFVVVSTDGMGGYICLDCSNPLFKEAPVVLCYFQNNESTELEVIATSFGDYLFEQIQLVTE